MLTPFLDWFEEHKVGIIGTLTLHTVILFALTFAQLRTEPSADEVSDMQLDVAPELEVEEMIERIIQGESGVQQKVTNLSSNIAAEIRPAFSPQRLAESVESELRELERAEFDRLAQERIDRGEKPAEIPELDPSRWDKQLYMDQAAQPARVEGATTVWHDLKEPLRAERHIHVPAYICKGYGQVVVNVSLGRDGKVRKAELDVARTTSNEDCMLESALRSARSAVFAANGTAPEPQQGSIYYRFMPQ